MNRKRPDKSFYKIPFNIETYNGMPYRRLGNSGLRVSNIGLGTWKMGYPETGDESRINESTAFALLEKAIDLGVTFWDTANRYNNASGNSERIIGAWLKKNPRQRRNVVVATKMGGAMDGITPNHNGLSRINILESVYASLERLQSDHIDLLYFHAFDQATPIEESLAAIEDLVRQDVVRYFGVSNFSVEQLHGYRKVEDAMGVRCRIVAVQNQFDILQGEYGIYRGVLDHAAKNGIAFIGWSPMARGLLTRKYLDPSKAIPGDRLLDEGILEKATSPEVMKKLHQLAALAEKWNMELNQLAIAYMLTLTGMGPIIAASSNVEQLVSNAAAGVIVLSDEQKEKIQEILLLA
ncbi:MAG: aldo/keto reductase [Chitinophagaceae bacterium]